MIVPPERCTTNSLKYGVLVLALVGSVVIVPSARAQVNPNDSAQKATDCDLHAGNQSDRPRIGAGIAYDAMKSDLAIAACQKAIATAPNVGRFHYQLGRAYMKAGQYLNMARSFQRASELGHAFAWVSLAIEYSSGTNLTKDLGLAAAYLKKAADQGDPEGQALYAEALFRGDGVAADAIEAISWLNKAIAQGHADAMASMGTAYSNGWGVAKDERQALVWVERAAQAGSVAAQGSLGYRYNQGLGVAKDQVKALEWTRKAAEAGSEIAQYNLAGMYERAEGVERNPSETYAWSRRAAEAGFAPAQLLLGRKLQRGEGVEKNEQEGLSWITKAAEQGDLDAMAAVAAAYERGIGTAKNPKEAFKWVMKCAETNDADCQSGIGHAYLNGIGVDIDTAKGKAWLEKSSKQGNVVAESFLVLQRTKDRLTESYSHYHIVKACFETRQGYLLPRISELELQEARLLMRKIDNATALTQMDKDELWRASVKESENLQASFQVWKMLGSDDARDSVPLDRICDAALASLRNGGEPKEGGTRKRDF